MNLNDTAIHSLAVAKDALLTPHGLDEGQLIQTLGAIFKERVDYADLYFQKTRSEAWSLEEGIVKSGVDHRIKVVHDGDIDLNGSAQNPVVGAAIIIADRKAEIGTYAYSEFLVARR